MSKLILEFDLETEREQYEDAVDGYKWHIAMEDLDNELRSIIKHAPELAENKNGLEMAEYIREMLYVKLNRLDLILFK